MAIEFKRKGNSCEVMKCIVTCGDVENKKILNKFAGLANDIFEQNV